jgi:hypothetical protein
MMSQMYHVWITDTEGNRSLLEYRNRSAWTFKTAIKHAEEFIELHGAHCTTVSPVED